LRDERSIATVVPALALPSVHKIRTSIKGVLERTASVTRIDRFGRWVRRGRAVILAYHNVVPDELAGMGDSSLHIPLSVFRRHLDLITQECRPVSLEDLTIGNWGRVPGPLTVAITFDDAYRGVLEVALPELVHRRLKATVFVAPALLGDQTLWWDALATTWLERPEIGLRSRVLKMGRQSLKAARLLGATNGAVWQEMPELLRTVTESELVHAAMRGTCTVGSHTWSHPSLPTLSDSELAEELTRSRDWLQDRFGRAFIDTVSYPFGHYSSRVETAARASGYRAAFALTAAPLPAGTAEMQYCLPRMNIPASLSKSGMSLRLGWW
jgi:peptidoglycan/xylan/chitin deacetylase (PgdA/CDA1 family)